MRILKIKSLEPKKSGWVDRDVIMTHACFQLLVDWVELEGGLTHSDYETHKETIDTLSYLYEWWIENNSNLYSNEVSDELVDKNLKLLIENRQFLWT
jgi:hypothetical protein